MFAANNVTEVPRTTYVERHWRPSHCRPWQRSCLRLRPALAAPPACRALTLWVAALTLAALLPGRSLIAGEQGQTQGEDPDLEVLRDAEVGTDRAGLIAYLHKCTPSEEQMRRVQGLVARLGSRRFKDREVASIELRTVGFFACGVLRDALSDADPEVARRARSCLGAYARYGRWCWAPGAALRRLRALHAREALPAILGYVPYAADQETLEEAWYCLDEFGTAGGRIDSRLFSALQDRCAPRRAVAACIIGRRGDANQRAAVRRLLDDPSALVRLRAAQGLLAACDTSGLEALIGLLRERAVGICWQAEELLRYAAGDGAPEATIGAATEGEREACCRAWSAWFSRHGASLDLGGLTRQLRRPGLVLVSEAGEYPSGGVALYGCDGAPRWRLRLPSTVSDMQLLPGDHVLLAEADANRVAERDMAGALFWSHRADRPDVCRRLPNGNTFMGNRGRVLEVGADGWQSYVIDPAPLYDGGDTLTPRAGGILAGLEITDRPPYTIREMHVPSGRVRRRITVPAGLAQCSGLTKLASGHYLLLAYKGGQRRSEARPSLVELDANASVIREFEVNHSGPPEPLHCGNTIVPSGEAVVEVDPRGRVRWEAFTLGTALRARACLPLVRFGFSGPPGVDLGNSLSYRLQGLRDRRPIVRARSALALSSFGPRATVALPRLVEMLADPDDFAAREAASAIQAIGPAAAPPLIRGLRDRRPEIRTQCARLLGDFPSAAPASVPALLPLLDDSAPGVRAAAASTLGPMAPKAKEVIPALLRAGSDTSRDVRVAAVESLGQAGTAAVPAVPFLLRSLRGADGFIADRAALALGSLGPVDKAVIPGLIGALEDERICTTAARAIGMMGRRGRPAHAALIRVLLRPAVMRNRLQLQSAAGYALSQLGSPGPKTINAMLSVLGDSNADPRLRESVATSLASFREAAASAIPSLVAILRNKQMPQEARVRAMECVLTIRWPDADTIAVLEEVVGEGKGELPSRAASALADIRNAAARRRTLP